MDLRLKSEVNETPYLLDIEEEDNVYYVTLFANGEKFDVFEIDAKNDTYNLKSSILEDLGLREG